MLSSHDIFDHIEYKLNLYKHAKVEKMNNLILLGDVLGFCLDIEDDINDLRVITLKRIEHLKKEEDKVNGK